jgi:hypothetical protein
MVKQERLNDMISKTKSSMDVLDAHKSKTKTSIAQISSISLVVNLKSLCINMDSIITVITTVDRLPLIFYHFLLNIVRITNNTEWVRMHDSNPGPMPNLHWYCYSFLEKIFNHMADFATDFGNVNMVSEGWPISDLHIQPIIRAARTIKAFEDNIILHQSVDTPIAILPSSIEMYTHHLPQFSQQQCILS